MRVAGVVEYGHVRAENRGSSGPFPENARIGSVAGGWDRPYPREVGEVGIVRAGVDRLDELVELWELLHRHQVSVAPAVPDLEALSEPASAAIVREMYREWLSGPDGFAYLAEEAGRSVGYVLGFYEEPHFMWETGHIGHIDSFFVLPELRGRGVGRQLMDAAYAEMRGAGATTVALELVADNELAQRFYEREGFTATFVQMHRRLTPTEPQGERADEDDRGRGGRRDAVVAGCARSSRAAPPPAPSPGLLPDGCSRAPALPPNGAAWRGVLRRRGARRMRPHDPPPPTYAFGYRHPPISGNEINGLGVTERTRPEKVFHNPGVGQCPGTRSISSSP